MIAIKRPDAPPYLADNAQKWMVETQQAALHYMTADAEPFEFKTYNDSVLKEALRKVFPKCAYCESNYGPVYDGDVEHFRPKGRIKERTPQTPGYYWLANDWDNLFLACMHCNQRRKHILDGTDTLEGYGKLDQFPLADESKRLTGPGTSLQQEDAVRLLIDPCKDNPDLHFEYEITEGVMVPISRMGEVSEQVYVLRRPLLVQNRKKKLIKLLGNLSLLKNLIEQLNEDSEDQRKIDAFRQGYENVLAFTNPDEEYAGMCRYFVRKFLHENGIV